MEAPSQTTEVSGQGAKIGGQRVPAMLLKATKQKDTKTCTHRPKRSNALLSSAERNHDVFSLPPQSPRWRAPSENFTSLVSAAGDAKGGGHEQTLL